MFWPEAMASLSLWSSPRACRDFHCAHNPSPARKPWGVCKGSSLQGQPFYNQLFENDDLDASCECPDLE